jgi:hypothetical protein
MFYRLMQLVQRYKQSNPQQEDKKRHQKVAVGDDRLNSLGKTHFNLPFE